MKDDVVIVSAARTPVGAFNGAFANVPAHELGKTAISAALERAGVEGGRVSEVIMGQILTAGQGQNPARQASIARRHSGRKPGLGRQQLCGSGLRAVALGYQAIMNGDSEIVVAGGQESMSMAPHAAHLRSGVRRWARFEMVDTMIKDGLWDAFNGYHMGTTAENVAKQYQITRAAAGRVRGRPRRTRPRPRRRPASSRTRSLPVTIKGRKGDIVVDTDEYPKTGVTLEWLTKLRPAFDKEGTVTAANASGINDGAAAVVLMSAAEAAKLGKTPLARIVSWAQAGVDPSIMGTGPIPASRAALKKAGWKHRRSRSGRSQRGLRRAGLRGQQGPRLGYRQGQRQRRRDRHRSSDRRVRRARSDHAAVRNAEAQRQEGPCDTVHRRRHGHCHVRRALRSSHAQRGFESIQTCMAGLVPAIARL